MSDQNTMCYVASRPGEPGYSFAAVDEPGYAKDNAKEIAKKVRMGFNVERVTVERAREGLSEYCNWKRASNK